MRKTLRGFTFFEVLIYLALFSSLMLALMNFSWNMFDLEAKGETERSIFSQSRQTSERLNGLIRNAAGIDTAASEFDTTLGTLVLEQLGTSDTVTIGVESGQVTVTETGTSGVALQGSDTETVRLEFTKYGDQSDGSEYVGYMLEVESAENDATRAPYRGTATLHSGAFIRNSGL